MENFLSKELIWTRKPKQVTVTRETIEIVTEPHTDLWQRTYYGFQNDNAPVLQVRTSEKYFSFTVHTRFDSKHRFDQCGVALYAGMSPSTYQSGQLKNCYPHMEKRGSRYLRYALYNATKYVCHWDPTFAAYLAKKRAEGKHYNVALSHATKKLVRLIFAMEKSRQPYCSAA